MIHALRGRLGRCDGSVDVDRGRRRSSGSPRVDIGLCRRPSDHEVASHGPRISNILCFLRFAVLAIVQACILQTSADAVISPVVPRISLAHMSLAVRWIYREIRLHRLMTSDQNHSLGV